MLLAVVSAFASLGAGSLPLDVVRLATARQQIAGSLQQLPNYTCVQTVERHETAHGLDGSTSADLIRVEVAYVNGREIYAVPGKRFSSNELSEMVGHGFTSTGLFAAFSRSIFLHSSEYSVRFGASEALDGVAAFRYEYQSNVGASPWHVRWRNQSGLVGERGSFWIRASDLKLLRLDVDATAIPSNLPYRSISVSIDYGGNSLDPNLAILPESAVVNAADFAGTEWVNRTSFSQCRRFGAASRIADGDTGEEIAAKAFSRVLPKAIAIGVDIGVPVLSIEDALSAAIEGVTRTSVHKGAFTLPAGSKVSGRLRRFTSLSKDSTEYLVSIELAEIHTSEGPIPFLASLAGAMAQPGVTVLNAQRCKKLLGPELAREECGAAIPGVVDFIVNASAAAKGFELRTVWKTGVLEVSADDSREHK